MYSVLVTDFLLFISYHRYMPRGLRRGYILKKLILMFAITSILCAAQVSDPRQSAPLERSRKIQATLHQQDGLHKAAIENGGSLTMLVGLSKSTPVHLTMQQLAGDSDLIVMGTTTGNKCVLNELGTSINTDFQFDVDSVLNGEPKTQHLTVTLPGGKVRYPDGVEATINVPSFKRLERNTQYVMFLRRIDANKFIPVGGPDGIFEITGGKLIPYAAENQGIQSLRGQDATAFIENAKTLMLRPERRILKKLQQAGGPS